MADNLRKYTTQEVLNKVFTDSSGNAIGVNSSTTKETLNAVFSTSDNSLNVALSGGTISGDVTISGDLTVNGSATNTYDELIEGQLIVRSASAGSVTAHADADDLVVENSAGGGMSILTPDGSFGALFFGSPSDNIGAQVSYRQSAAEMLIGTRLSGGVLKLRTADGTTALTIDSSQNATFAGDVVVGDITLSSSTISDSSALTISSGDDITIDAESDVNIDANGGDIRFKDNGTNFVTFSSTGSTGTEFVNGSSAFFITPDGNNCVLKLKKSASNRGARFTYMEGTSEKWHQGLTDSDHFGSGGDEYFISEDFTTPHFIIESGGNIGMGGLPSSLLHLQGNNGNASHTLLKIHNNDNTGSGETGQTADIEFNFQGSTNGGSSYVTKNAGAIRAGKDTDYHTSSADNMDSHLKFYTAQDNVNTLALTLGSDQSATFSQTVDGDAYIALDNVAGAGSSVNETAALRLNLGDGTTLRGGAKITAKKELDYSTGANMDASLMFSVLENNAYNNAMHLSSAGRLGIGDSEPLARLHIQDSSTGAVQAFIINTNGATDSSADLAFGTWSGAIPTGTGNPGPQAKISAINTNSGTAATDLAFSTYGSSGTSSEHMRITNAGNVAIGTDNPDSQFHLHGSTGIRLTDSNQNANEYAEIKYDNGGVTNLYINNDWTGSNALINFQLAGSTKMVVRGDGNVGINETDPSHKLDVDGGIVEQGGVLKENLITNSGFGVWSNGTLENVGSDLVTNGGFDSNTTSWAGTDASLASVSGGQSGNCLELTRTGASNQYAKQTNVTLVVGKLYRFSFYVKSGTSGNEAFTAYCYDGTTVHSVSGTSTGSWVQYTKVFEMGGSDSTLNEITLSKSTATAGTMLFDTVSLYEVTPACIAADTNSLDGWGKSTNADLYREHDGSNTKDGSFYALYVKPTVAGQTTEWPKNKNEPTHLKRFAGRTVAFGCWIKSDNSSAGIYIHDNDAAVHSQHTGGGAYEWLEVTKTLASDIDEFQVVIRGYGETYASQPMLVFGNSIGEGNYTRPNGETIYLETSLTSAKLNGSAFSDVSETTLNVEADSLGKIPKGAKAILTELKARDSGSAGTDCFVSLGANEKTMLRLTGVANDSIHHESSITPCDSNGDLKYRTEASGSDTLDAWALYHGVELR
jgi:hypothetical protein